MIEGSILTGPILFTVFGLVAGPAALGLIPLQIGNEANLFAIVTVTVTLSVALHGMTAGPAARRYGFTR